MDALESSVARTACPLGGFGTARALWRLSRPRFTLWLLWIPLIGYGLALWDRALDWTRPGAFLLVLGAWPLLSAGTLWLNAALDQGDRGALFACATPLPPHLRGYGLVALAAGVALGFGANFGVGVCAAACAALAVLYSHPLTAWKGHPWLGPAVNAAGYGVLSSLAGWLVVGVSMNARTALSLGLMTLWLLGASFAAQAFQQQDDARHGYRTLVVTHGPRVCLRAARWCMNLALGGVLCLSAVGYYPRLLWGACPFFVLADRWLQRWLALPDGGDSRWAAGLIHRMLLGGLAMFVLAYADYLVDYHQGAAVAGLNTAAGRPSDVASSP